GQVIDENGNPLDSASIFNTADSNTYYSDSKGNFKALYVPHQKNKLVIDKVHYYRKTISIPKLFKDEDYSIKIELSDKEAQSFGPFRVKSTRERRGIITIQPHSPRPSPGNDFLDLIQ